MGYAESLKAAGAEVLEYARFGDWQGSWIALTIRDGKKQIVCGSYGSCSGCDAFEAEFGYESHYVTDHNGNETWHSPYGEESFVDGCEECVSYKTRLAEFGESYFKYAQDPADFVAELEKSVSEMGLDDYDWNDSRHKLETVKLWNLSE